MFLPIPEKRVFELKDLTDYLSFFENIRLILPNESDIICFAGHDPKPEIKEFLVTGSIAEISRGYDFSKPFFVYKDVYPNSYVAHQYLTGRFLISLLSQLTDIKTSLDFCDHMFGYGSMGPIFSFQKAFLGAPINISMNVGSEKVRRFCEKTKSTFGYEDQVLYT